jgi:hypothetical protein
MDRSGCVRILPACLQAGTTPLKKDKEFRVKSKE